MTLALVLVAVYAAVAIAAFIFQRRLMYFPDVTRVPPSNYGLIGVEERVLDMPDGARLVGWYGRAAPGRPTVLYLHGNAGNLANRSERVRKYFARGYGDFHAELSRLQRLDGPAHGARQRRRREARLRGVAQGRHRARGHHPIRGIAWLRRRRAGRSRKSRRRHRARCALHLDRRRGGRAPIRSFPCVPSWSTATTRLRYLRDVKAPLLVVHGEEDDVIPVAMGRAVYAAANGPKEIVTLPGAGHSDHHLHGSTEEIFRWIEASRPPPRRDGWPEKRMRP